MLEADPNFKKSMKFCQGIEKMLTLPNKLYNKKAMSAQSALEKQVS
jgi:hypothetical protein